MYIIIIIILYNMLISAV